MKSSHNTARMRRPSVPFARRKLGMKRCPFNGVKRQRRARRQLDACHHRVGPVELRQ